MPDNFKQSRLSDLPFDIKMTPTPAPHTIFQTRFRRRPNPVSRDVTPIQPAGPPVTPLIDQDGEDMEENEDGQTQEEDSDMEEEVAEGEDEEDIEEGSSLLVFTFLPLVRARASGRQRTTKYTKSTICLCHVCPPTQCLEQLSLPHPPQLDTSGLEIYQAWLTLRQY